MPPADCLASLSAEAGAVGRHGTHNTELAEGLASLAADDGLLLIGVDGAAACGGSPFVASTRMVAAQSPGSAPSCRSAGAERASGRFSSSERGGWGPRQRLGGGW